MDFNPTDSDDRPSVDNIARASEAPSYWVDAMCTYMVGTGNTVLLHTYPIRTLAQN